MLRRGGEGSVQQPNGGLAINNALTFNDIFKKSFLESGGFLQAVTPAALLQGVGCILLVHYTGDGVEERVRRALGTNPYKIKSKTLRKHDVKMAIEVRLRRGGTAFIDALQGAEGVSDVTLVQYSGDYIDW
jgi:hypothetical protein